MEIINLNENENQLDYAVAYIKGYNKVMYAIEAEKIIDQDVACDHSSFDSMGYHDGFVYASNCIRSGRQYDTPNLEAQIFNDYMQACNKYEEYVKNNQGRNK